MQAAARLDALRAALASLEAQRYSDVIAACAALMAADPSDPDARTVMKAAGCRAMAAPLVDSAVAGLVQAGAMREAAEVRAAAIQRAPTLAGPWSALATLQERGGDAAAAVRTLRQGLQHATDAVGLRCQLALVLARQDKADDALVEADAARRAAPEHLRPVWTALRCLPLVHEDARALAASRASYVARLADFEAAVAAASMTRARAALAFAQDVFPAHYACHADDAALQLRFGGAVHALVAKGHPELVAPLAHGLPRARVRVGFVSSLLRQHTVSKLFGPWVLGLDPERFDVHVWQLGRVDAVTHRLCAGGATLHTAEGRGTAALGGAIRAAGLDALVFPEVGMDARVILLAAMRLAPFQAVAWGHPVTTGLPTVDAFLSSADMEPSDADADYTESLVRLPGLGTGFVRPPPPARVRDRAFFGLPSGVPLLLCTQSLFKLLPRQDDVFRRILAAVPDAHLAVLRLTGAPRTLARFERAGLPMERVHVVPPLRFPDFLDLNASCDVLLDGLDWSGGVTTLEAVACGRVVVTMSGPLMRMRHTAAVMVALGLPELVASDADAYVQTAVRLAKDPAWRHELETRAAEGARLLYEDDRSTHALAALLETRGG